MLSPHLCVYFFESCDHVWLCVIWPCMCICVVCIYTHIHTCVLYVFVYAQMLCVKCVCAYASYEYVICDYASGVFEHICVFFNEFVCVHLYTHACVFMNRWCVYPCIFVCGCIYASFQFYVPA